MFNCWQFRWQTVQWKEETVAGSDRSSVQKRRSCIRVPGVHLHACSWRESQDLRRRHDQGSRRESQHGSVRENNQWKDNQHQMRQKKKWNKNNGNSGTQDIDPKKPIVSPEPRESVEWQENNRRKRYWSRSNDWNVLESKRKDEKKKSWWKHLRQKRDIKKRKLQELSESKPRLSEDAEYFRRELINSIERPGKGWKIYQKILEIQSRTRSASKYEEWTQP